MKFKYKLTFCMIGLMSVVFAVGGSLLITLSFNDMLAHEKENAYNSYKTVVNTFNIMGEYNGMSISETAVMLTERRFLDDVAIRVTSEDGEEYSTGNVLFIDTVEMVPDSVSLVFVNDTFGKEHLQLSGYVPFADKVLCVDLGYDISSVYEIRDSQQKIYMNIFIVMITVCAILSYLLSVFMTRPLSSLSNATRRIAEGDLSTRADIQTNDEVGVVADDFNNMAEKLEENINELQLAMERQESFMGSFAHELKTPMTSIIGYADLIRTDSLNENERTEAANYIFTEGKRLENLSLKLLDLLVLRKGEIELVRTSPSQLVTNLVEHLRPVYRCADITLQYKCEQGYCLLEPDLVKSLLVNLIDNARKALANGGNIVVSSEMTENGCRFCVFDNGRGIPSESLEHLTQAFYRVDKSRAREQGGVGLGLALCNEIAKLHNGDIKFKSREGNGTLVSVELRGGRV